MWAQVVSSNANEVMEGATFLKAIYSRFKKGKCPFCMCRCSREFFVTDYDRIGTKLLQTKIASQSKPDGVSPALETQHFSNQS